MKQNCYILFFVLMLLTGVSFSSVAQQRSYDLVIIGGTPGGIMTAVAAARSGKTCLILERTNHVGGLPSNGLGATDISTKGATGGLFMEFVSRIKSFYSDKYGAKSIQVKDCDSGFRFEPHVAEHVFEQMIGEQPKITVLKNRQFDAIPNCVVIANNVIKEITVTNRTTSIKEHYKGSFFIDATYEGDLIAAAGVPYAVGREDKTNFNEPYAGRVFHPWGGGLTESSTFLGDNSVQSYNYRLCLTQDPALKLPITQPKDYNRTEYLSLIDDIRTGRNTSQAYYKLTSGEKDKLIRQLDSGSHKVNGVPFGISRIVNRVAVPNRKFDANNQHLSLLSTDLPEENWPWPTSSWEWRDQFAERLKNYTLGLLWFAQNDQDLPEWFRKDCQTWGLAKDEFEDNSNFPRQVYVREGRRMKGMYVFTANDALPLIKGQRPPVSPNSITSSHYGIDSHAVRKREANQINLDGMLSFHTSPYTVPFGVMVPLNINNLLSPVPVSSSHIGLGTLRMEPCWMALGHAAGLAACISLNSGKAIQKISIKELQQQLLNQKAVLIYIQDVPPEDPDFAAFQFYALNGLVKGYQAFPEDIISQDEMKTAVKVLGLKLPENYTKGQIKRRDFVKWSLGKNLN